jgi:hypothetical protein
VIALGLRQNVECISLEHADFLRLISCSRIKIRYFKVFIDMKRHAIRLTIAALALASCGVQADVIIADQDNYVLNSQSGTVQDHTANLVVKRASNNIRKSWIRFDLDGQNADTSQSGTVTLTLAGNSSSDTSFRIALYALNDGEDPGWIESGVGGITWSNAPGNDTSGAGINDLEPGETTLLGETANIAASTSAGTAYQFTIPMLSTFLQPDDTLTVIAISSFQPDPGPTLAIASSENATAAWRPSLTFTAVPEPSSLMLSLLGFTGLLTAIRRHR